MSSAAQHPEAVPPASTKPAAIELDGTVVGHYKIVKTIGQGTYGKVKLAYHVQSGQKYAIKVIEKAQIQSAKQVARLQREIRFLKLLHHPHIVKVYDVIETAECIFIAMEHVSGGELFDYIVAHKRVKEKESRSFFRMVLSAVEYCHQNSVIHRDLKPENLLLDENKCIKIIDFGFGNNFTPEGLLDTFCGSPFYAAPEMILGKKYEGPEVDMWSLGVILFALLCGHLPFDDDNIKELYKKISSGTYTSPDYLMPNARHLIGRLITVDPKKRATLEEVLAHPWVNEGYDGPPPSYLPERPVITDPSLLSKDIVSRLLAFGYKTDEIHRSFSPSADQSKPNAVRATYFLLAEMLQREETKLRNERRGSLNPNAARRDSSGQLRPLPGRMTSLSTNNVLSSGQSLNSIDENTTAPVRATTPMESDKPRNPLLEKLNQKEYGSLGHLSTGRDTRRASTPDHSVYPRPASAQPNGSQPSVATVEQRLANVVIEKTSSNDSQASEDTLMDDRSSTSSTIHRPKDTVPIRKPSNLNPASNSIPIDANQMVAETTRTTHNTPSLIQSKAPTSPLASTPVIVVSNNQVTTEAVSATSATPPPLQQSANASSGGGRRFSMPLNAQIPPRRGSMHKMKEELRAVSGWFLNVSTTSSKTPNEIITEVTRVLKENGVQFAVENNYTMVCEVDMSEPLLQTEAKNNNPGFSSDTPEPKQSKSSSGAVIAFQIEVCKIPKLTLYGLHFKRLSGGVWNYKKVCNRLLAQMSL